MHEHFSAYCRYLIYRIVNGTVVHVDSLDYTGADLEFVKSFVEDHYLYDSPNGERYFVVDKTTGGIMAQWRVEIPQPAKRLVSIF